MKKLMFVNQTLGMGGAEIFNADLLDWLTRQGVEVLAYCNFPPLIKLLKSKNITASHIPFVIDLIGDWKGLIKGLLLLPIGFGYFGWQVYRNRAVDVIFMTGFIEKVLVAPWAYVFRVPVVWLEFAPVASIYHKFAGLPGLLHRWVQFSPRTIIVPTRNTFMHLQLPRMHVISLGRSITTSDYSRVAVQNFKVTTASRLELGKGQDLLLRAWPQVLTAIPRAKLVLVGEGGFRSELQHLVTTTGIASSVRFVGEKSNNQTLVELASAQVCVFPTVWPAEGFGLVAIEAMAVGRPVVGFAAGPIPEIITEDVGILVEVGQVDHLAQAIIKLLRDPTLGNKMGKGGQKRFLAKYAFDKIGPQYAQVFAAAGSHTRPRSAVV